MRAEFWFGSLKGKDHSEGFGIDGWLILNWILEKEFWSVCELDSFGSGYGQIASSCEHGRFQ
jgi:hypothetical protein